MSTEDGHLLAAVRCVSGDQQQEQEEEEEEEEDCDKRAAVGSGILKSHHSLALLFLR